MIFFIGGPPRVGKSIISGKIQQQHAMSVVSTDTLGAVLARVVSPEMAPDLFVFDTFQELPMTERVAFIIRDPTALIEYVRKESRVVWNAVEAFLRREQAEGRDVLIEGVAVLPELVSQLEDVPFRAAFLGNRGEHHRQNIKQSAQEHADDWMRNVGDDYIDAFALFVTQMSAYVEREAKARGFEYIEMSEQRFEDVADVVMLSLGLSVR